MLFTLLHDCDLERDVDLLVVVELIAYFLDNAGNGNSCANSSMTDVMAASSSSVSSS